MFVQSKKSSSRQYLRFLDKTGLSVSICQLRWYSPVFNRCFLRVGQWRPSFLRLWFTAGVFVALVTMLLSVFLLCLLVYNTLRQEPVEQQVLTPVVIISLLFMFNFKGRGGTKNKIYSIYFWGNVLKLLCHFFIQNSMENAFRVGIFMIIRLVILTISDITPKIAKMEHFASIVPKFKS